ncbi:MAG: UDP-N-acetylglucosamine 2-epimerase (non-hydrolyzing) [Desulfobacteraceae bacterium]|nr:UDP-N-acetylglucosamine 2-epimerase (non-hydrolyzing) [Desulfobacteraceae bacterium]
MELIKVMAVFGTRPEAIKMAPVVKELQKHQNRIHTIVTLSAQHREMLDQVMELFEIKSDYDLNIMTYNQKLSGITCNVIQGLEPVLEKEKVDFILVQGDTTTTFAASLIGFYHKIPVGHVEAGLRTYNKYNPFPEEINRVLTSSLSNVHFAPTRLAKKNLLKEGIPEESVIITGNSVIDAFLMIVEKEGFFKKTLNHDYKKILVTAHRRENWGKPLENICNAILDIVTKHPDVKIVFPVHLNPNVQKTVYKLLGNHNRIKLTDPMGYRDIAECIADSHIILSDSGGIQEEAPSLGKPVLVLRNETERQEGIDAGTCRLVGTEREKIVHEADKLLTDSNQYLKMAQAVNPYGDGKTSQRIAEYIIEHF